MGFFRKAFELREGPSRMTFCIEPLNKYTFGTHAEQIKREKRVTFGNNWTRSHFNIASRILRTTDRPLHHGFTDIEGSFVKF